MFRKGFISLFLLLLTAVPAWAEVVIIVRREAQPTGNYVRVCDIARVDGPAEQAREVAMTVIGPAPVRGETHEITRWDIETRLYEMGVNARVTFTGNDVVRVLGSGAPRRRYAETAFQPLDATPEGAFSPTGGMGGESGRQRAASRIARKEEEKKPIAKPAPTQFDPKRPEREGDRLIELAAEGKKRVAEAIGDYFSDRYRAGNARRADIEVSASVVGATGGVPASAFELRVEDAEGKIPGRAKVTLLVKDEAESEARRVIVAADTDVFGLALVTTRNLSRGESLKPEDVKVARVRMEWGRNYLPPRPKTVVGREAKRSFRPGEVLFAEDAAQGEAVKRSQLVIVDSSGKGWRLQTKAKAQGSGAVGDIITVEDLETKKKYPARITGHGTVSVVVNKDKIIFDRD